MTEIREAIEEMIEESYLLGLTEAEIREDLHRFAQFCIAVIRGNVKDGKTAGQLEVKLRLASARALTAEGQGYGDSGVRSDGTLKSTQELLAEKAARTKRMILKAIEEYDPRLVLLIEKRRYHTVVGDQIPKARRGGIANRTKILILKSFYAMLVILLLLLIWIAFLNRG